VDEDINAMIGVLLYILLYDYVK